VRQEFLVEIGDGAGIADLAQLNKLFTAWYETVYHARPHGETGQPPIERWLAGAPFPTPSPAQLREAFLWAEWRLVAKTATIKLFGGVYETDPVLAGRRVECVFDPFDLAVIEVRWNGRPYAWQSRSTSAGTPIPRRNRRLPPRRRPGPASTT
jgi:putative transposase